MQQERERKHTRLKQQMIMEYEIRRVRERDLPLIKRRSSQRSHGNNRSKSAESQHRRRSRDRRLSIMLSENIQSSNRTSVLKNQERTEIDPSVLRKIKVGIHRNILPNEASTNRLERAIINPEDVVVKRRDGEGSKPIFGRETLKRAMDKFEEIENHNFIAVKRQSPGKGIFEPEKLERSTNKFEEIKEHRVVSLNRESAVVRSDKSKRRSVSGSPLQKGSHNPRRTLSRYSRGRDRSRGRSRERKERYKSESRHRLSPCNTGDHSRHRRSHHYSRDRSWERDRRNWDRDVVRGRDVRSYRDYRKKSRDRSRERRERERSRERTPPPPHYMEQVPVPVYCGLSMLKGGPLLEPMGPIHPSRFTSPETYRRGPPPRFWAYVLME